MMYMGSKRRIAKYIVPIIREIAQQENVSSYVEPFVGGANLIDKIDFIDRRVGNDINYYVIELFKALQLGWVPPEHISKTEYLHIKENQNDFAPEIVAFVALLCSFGGKWWGGYARNAQGRNYARAGKNVLLKQKPFLTDVEFLCNSYDKLNIPNKSLVYCDPPYFGTTKYKDNFDHDKFWNWCRTLENKRGIPVIISEYAAPKDFECIMEIDHYSTLNKNKKVVRIEKLFRLSTM